MILTCGTDKAIRLWPLNSNSTSNQQNKIEPVSVLLAKDALMDADWQSDSNSFATAGETVSIWDSNVFKPVHSFKWGSATCGTVNFNKVEKQLLFATSSDRAVALFDVRAKSPANKLTMKMVTNSVCWNPMEPFNFILASEDSNVYSFDVRNFNKAKMVHEDHLNAVMSVDFSPTGKEFVTGSYDKTIRIFKTNTSKSREIYHTKRMQRVFATKFSLASRFVFSGSDDTNIRVWKANASEKLGILTKGETNYLNYCEKLKEKFKFMPEIRKISRHRHLPKTIYKGKKKREIMKAAQSRREKKFEKSTKQKYPKKEKKKEAIVGVVN